jgi:hypothetical protein
VGTVKEKRLIYELFGDDVYAPDMRGFSVERVRIESPKGMWRKVKWARRVATIYLREEREGRADGRKRKGFVNPYPRDLAPERFNPHGQAAARSRGGKRRKEMRGKRE